MFNVYHGKYDFIVKKLYILLCYVIIIDDMHSNKIITLWYIKK